MRELTYGIFGLHALCRSLIVNYGYLIISRLRMRLESRLDTFQDMLAAEHSKYRKPFNNFASCYRSDLDIGGDDDGTIPMNLSEQAAG